MLLYFFLALAIGLLIRKRNIRNPLYKKFFIPGLLVKLLGGISFGLVHTFYFTYGGDTKSYFHDMSMITGYFYQDPGATVAYLFNKYSYLNNEIIRNTIFSPDTKEFFLVRFATFINIFGLNSYWSTTILFASFSFIGTWQLFLVFARKYPAIWKQMAWAALFLPSLVFWGSGIMKDTLGVGFLGVFLFSVNHIYEKGKLNLWYLFLIGLSVYIILSVRAHIVFGLLPAMMIWISLGLKNKIRNPLLKMTFMPFMIVLMVAGSVASFVYLGKYNSQFSVDNVIGTAWSYQHWHYVEGQNTSDQHGRGSSYTLGDYDPTPLGVMKMFFPAVNAALYRPYFWEVKNPAMAILALESFAFFIFTLFIFFKVGPIVLFRAAGKDSFLLMSLVFSIFFSFAVGFSTYNFGALARYKIPALPFYAMSLLVLNYYANYYRELRKKGKATRKFGAAVHLAKFQNGAQ
jgi:hypothetical protein